VDLSKGVPFLSNIINTSLLQTKIIRKYYIFCSKTLDFYICNADVSLSDPEQIGKDVATQYVEGWDWMAPIR